MSEELQTCTFGEKEFAPWLKGASFNAYKTYSFVNNSAFYASTPPYYRPFMTRYVQQWLQWYDGYVPSFHNQDSGILSTRLATSLVNKITAKVAGSRIMFKNAGKVKDTDGSNKSCVFVAEWGKRTDFEKKIKRLLTFSGAAGTALIKLNQDRNGELWTESVRFDRFTPSVDNGTGKLSAVKCYLMTLTSLLRDDYAEVYRVCEHRHYADFKPLGASDDAIERNVPVVEYNVFRASGNITSGVMSLSNSEEKVPFKTLPKKVRSSILESYGVLLFDTPKRLPFDDLGCELVPWTEGVSGLPELPFGDSVIANVMSYLQLYDYLHSAMATDMYLGRGRVIVPQSFTQPGAMGGVNDGWSSGLDSMLYAKLPGGNPEEQSITPVQFDLRSEAWKSERNTLLESIAVNICISPSTVGAFLNDNSNRTAREVSTEENETAAYVAKTRAIVEVPINRILDTVCKYYGLEDKVEIRWSQAGLSNQFLATEMKVQQIASGLISVPDAIADLNPDDDDEQIALKVKRANQDYERRAQQGGALPFDDSEGDMFGGGAL